MTKAAPTYKVFHFLRSKESVSLDEFKHVLSAAAASAKEDSASYFPHPCRRSPAREYLYAVYGPRLRCPVRI